MTLPTEWYREVAKLERSELVDALEREAELRAGAVERSRNLEAKLRDGQNKPYVLIARTFSDTQYPIWRMRLDPRRVKVVATEDPSSFHKLRGRCLTAEDCRLVRGWSEGRHVEELRHTIAPCGVNLDAVSYAPDPYIDMLEFDDFDQYIGWKKENL